MKSIKRFYLEHRIFIILLALMIVGFIIIFTVLMQCFYGSYRSSKEKEDSMSKYGARLENIEKYKIDESRFNEYEEKMLLNEDVSEANIMLTGRIVYIKITFKNDIDLTAAQSLALQSLEDFSEAEKGYYDFHFTLSKPETETSSKFLISGAKNKTSSTIVWNNNRVVLTD